MNAAVEVADYFKLVHFVIHKFCKYHPGIEYDDLFQIGCIGLIQAMRTYESGHEAKFSTWAVLKIKSRIYDALRHASAKKRTGNVVSLDAPLRHDGSEAFCLLDLVVDPRSAEAFQAVEWNDSDANEWLTRIKREEKIMTVRKAAIVRKTVKQQPAESPVNTYLDLSGFIIYNALNSNCARKGVYSISVTSSGKITLSTAIGKEIDVGTKLEIKINENFNTIVVYPSDVGLACTLNGKNTEGKQIACKKIMYDAKERNIKLPIKFMAEYNKTMNAWVGRKYV